MRRGNKRASVVAAACTLVLGTACQGGSVAAFCDTLADGEENLQEVSAQAQQAGNPITAFLTAYGGLGEFEQMLDDLVDAAPSDVADDMERTRDAFATLSEPVADASVSGLAASLAANLDVVLREQAAFRRVDAFAQQECGSELFGLGSLASSLGALSEPAPDDAPGSDDEPSSDGEPETPVEEEQDPRCQELEPVLDSDADPAGLISALDAAVDLETPGTEELLRGLEDLDLGGYEAVSALTRVRWTEGLDPAQVLVELNDRAVDVCDRPVVDEDLPEIVEGVGPQPADEGPGLLGTYETSPSSTTSYELLAVDSDLLLFERGDNVYVLDLTTGLVDHHEHDFADSFIGDPVLSDGNVFWVDVHEHAAQGLEPATREYELLRWDAPGDDPQVLRTWEVGQDGGTVRLLAGASGHLLIYDDAWSVYDTDGELVEQLGETGGSPYADHLIGDVYSTTSGNLSLGAAAWHPDWSDDSTTDAGADRCFETAMGPGFGVALTPDGTVDYHRLKNFGSSMAMRKQAFVDGGVVREDTSDGLQYFPQAGNEPSWTIDGSVIHEWGVFAGRLFVLSVDEALLEVELKTGADQPADRDIAELIGDAWLGELMVVDHRTGLVVATGPSGQHYRMTVRDECAVIDNR